MKKITIVAKGGGNTDEYLIRYIMRIQRKIEEIDSDFSIPLEIRFLIEIRIDGDIFSYGDPAGCSHLKFFKKKGLIAITIAITDNETALPTDELLDFLKESIFTGFSQMFDRLLKDKYTLNKEELMNFIKENIDSVQKPTEVSL